MNAAAWKQHTRRDDAAFSREKQRWQQEQNEYKELAKKFAAWARRNRIPMTNGRTWGIGGKWVIASYEPDITQYTDYGSIHAPRATTYIRRSGELVGLIQPDFDEKIAQFIAKYDYPWP